MTDYAQPARNAMVAGEARRHFVLARGIALGALAILAVVAIIEGNQLQAWVDFSLER